MARNKLALVGIGKIALDQHVPALAASPDWELAATVSRHGSVEGIEGFADIQTMLDKRPEIGTVSLCLPPVPRFHAAQAVLRAGRNLMLEKPPGATLAEVHILRDLAQAHGVSLYATWHSRMAEGVEAARRLLADRAIQEGRITWREDVRKWHPGQDWIFEAGGMGVFDPGINALSILTEIMPHPVHLTSAEMEFPENCETPIAARLAFEDTQGSAVTADFDFRQTGPQTWDIAVETSDGSLKLSAGGAKMEIDGRPVDQPAEAEYDGIYARFAELLAAGESDVDASPLVHVADAFMLGRRIVTDPFHDE